MDSRVKKDVENEASEITRDKKILCNATIDQDFDDSSVLVIMDNITGGINKQHDLSFFGNIGATAVTDLTVLSNETLVSSGLSTRTSTDDTTVGANKLSWFEVNAETFRQILKIELSVHSKENVLNVIKKLEKIEGIKYAGPNYKLHLCSDNLDSTRSVTDEQVNRYPWGIRKINAIGAWNITLGSNNIKVGIIDSGIAPHPNLLDNLVAGSNFIDNSETEDSDGHGTQVAGVIGAVAGSEDGIYIQGVCKNVSLVPLKVYSAVEQNDNGDYVANGNLGDVIDAVTYATNQGIHIINFSMEIDSDAPVPTLAQEILNYPGLFVASAGNKGRNNDNIAHYPSEYTTTLTNVISVGASDQTTPETIRGDSNFGATTVDLFAPGSDVKTTSVDGNGDFIAEYGIQTSIAAPHVTGAAALIMSVRPDMSPAEVKKCIMDSVDKSSAFAGKCVSGGRLNVYKAVQLATQPQTFTGDVNDDGKADMIITRRTSDGKRAIDAYIGQADGMFDLAYSHDFSQVYNYQDPVFVGDVNGDGKTDLIVHTVVAGKRYMHIYRAHVNETTNVLSFIGPTLCVTTDDHDYYTTKAKFFVADVNGDKKDDFIVHTKNSSGKRVNLTYLGQKSGSIGYFDSTASVFTSTNNYAVDPVFIGYFNNDEFPDMVVPHANSSGKRCLLVYKGQESAPYFAAGVKFNSTRNHNPLQWPCQYFVNDVNGDGKDDLIVHWKDTNGKRNNLVYKGSSSGLTTEAVATAATSNNYIAKDPVFVGDINGDGCGDMLVQWANSNNKRNLLVYKGTTSATYGTGNNYTKNETLDLTTFPSCFFLDDVDGDGRDDFIVKYCITSGRTAFITYTGASTGAFSDPNISPYFTTPYFNN